MLTSKKRVGFAVCVSDEGYDDLEVWKVYQVLVRCKGRRSRLYSGYRRVWRGLSLPGESVRSGEFPRECPVAPTEMAAKQREQGASSGLQKQAAAQRLIEDRRQNGWTYNLRRRLQPPNAFINLTGYRRQRTANMSLMRVAPA